MPEEPDEPNKRPLHFVIGFVLLASLSLFWGAVWGLSSTYTRNHIQAEEAARDYAEDANRQISERCLRLAPPAMTECISTTIQASREDQRSEGNLEAQRNPADWTGAMAILAGLGLMLSAGGVGLVYFTFQQARRSADAAQKTYQAFVSVEDASLVVEFGQGRLVETWVGNIMQTAVHDLPITVTNIGRSAARLHGWTMNKGVYDLSFVKDHTLKAGHTWDGLGKLEFDRAVGDFTIFFSYSSPIRERMRLEVSARLYAIRDDDGNIPVPVKAGARVISMRLREPA